MSLVTTIIESRVATITMDSPENLNALSDQLKTELTEALASAADNSEVKVVVLTGSGRAFSAGGDISNMGRINEPYMRRERMIKGINPLVNQIWTMEKPVIAAVNGYAVGVGCILAVACDLVVAVPQAKFGVPFNKIGLVPDGGGTYLLPKLVGALRAKEMVLLRRTLSAQEALNWGLVNKIVPPEQLAGEVKGMAEELAEGPSVAIGLSKVLINRAQEDTLMAALEREAGFQGLCVATEDHEEGVKAFFEKRPAKFN